MPRYSFVFAAVVSLSLGAPVSATEPGTPMNCSDLVLAAGLTCSEVTQPLEDRSFGEVPDKAIDNEGRVLDVGKFDEERVGTCGAPLNVRRANLVVAFDREGNRSIVVAATDRCVDAAAFFFEGIDALGALFDPVRGSLLLHLQSRCQRGGTGLEGGCPYSGPPQQPTHSERLSWIARIDGFSSLPQVLPSQCSNGLDDDGDGLVDGDDPHCKSDADNDESRP